MATSAAEANRVLDDKVSSGLSRWVGLSLTHPTPAEMDAGTVSEVDGTYLTTPRISVPMDGATSWTSAASRAVHCLLDFDFGNALAAFTPEGWVLWDASTGGNAVDARRVNSEPVDVGQQVTLPGTTLEFVYPDLSTL
jgi:hypothetical protein